MNAAHVTRIIEELKAAGATRHGLAKPEAKELPRILHEDEHVGGVVYGQVGSGNSAMLVATDQRVVFLDKRPLFMSADEITYDAVSGVKSNAAGPFLSVVLHTRIGDYSLRYVNAKCAAKFVKFIDDKRLKKSFYNQSGEPHPVEITAPPLQINMDEKALKYLKANDEAVFSTIDRTGNVHGAIVHYIVENNLVYILTKSGTSKGRNIFAHHQVALTIHKTGSLKTLQMQGIAEVEPNPDVKIKVFEQIVKPHDYNGEKRMPPVTRLHEGAFMVIRISPTYLNFHDYAKA